MAYFGPAQGMRQQWRQWEDPFGQAANPGRHGGIYGNTKFYSQHGRAVNDSPEAQARQAAFRNRNGGIHSGPQGSGNVINPNYKLNYDNRGPSAHDTRRPMGHGGMTAGYGMNTMPTGGFNWGDAANDFATGLFLSSMIPGAGLLNWASDRAGGPSISARDFLTALFGRGR